MLESIFYAIGWWLGFAGLAGLFSLSVGRWLLYAPVALITAVIAYPLVPIAVVFANEETGRLPRIFRWLETPDDLGPRAGMYEEAVRAVYERFGWRIKTIYWLWRNPAAGVSASFGFKSSDNMMEIVHGPIDVGDEHQNGPWGAALYKVTNYEDDGFHDEPVASAWELYVAIPYGASRYGLRIRLGWKLQTILRVPSQRGFYVANIVCHINPLSRLRME